MTSLRLSIAVCALLAHPGFHAAPQAVAGLVYPRAMQQFLARTEQPHHYRAVRRLEAENRSAGKRGWLEAWTELTPGGVFRYEVVAEGGSDYIRTRVLRAVLDGEKDMLARGASSRSAIASSNYTFESDGVDGSGLVKMLLAPRRREGMLLTGAMFLDQTEGDLVRIEGRLARNPSFWVKKVDIVRHYQRIDGVLVPVALQSTAQVRFLGPSTLRMTYDYTAINGRPIE